MRNCKTYIDRSKGRMRIEHDKTQAADEHF